MTRYRSEKFLRWVRRRTCLTCGRMPSQAHHPTHLGNKARGLKAPDNLAVPLCYVCHGSLHADGGEEIWWATNGVDPVEENRKLRDAYAKETGEAI